MSTMSMIGQLASGMLATCEIFVLTLVFSLPLGLLVAFGRMSKIKPVQLITKIYISIMRGTPLMLQLLVVYFGPYYLFGMRLSTSYRFTATIIGFAVNYAAYFAEIYRSGIQSIPEGQREAAKVLGYTKNQTFFKIIFPQMVKRVLPSVTSDHVGKGHLTCVCACLRGDVHDRETDRGGPDDHDAVICGRSVLLYL